MIYPPGFQLVGGHEAGGRHRPVHARPRRLPRVTARSTSSTPTAASSSTRRRRVVAIDPGHDGWVVGKEPVVLIEFDFEGDTVAQHGHARPRHK